MAFQFTIPHNAVVVELLAPATDAAGRSATSYLTLKNAHKAFAVFHIAQGNASTVLLSVNQAKDVSGTSTKAITAVVPIWLCADTSVSDLLVAQTAALTFTTSAATKNKIIVFEIDPSLFDVANGFCTFNVTTGASNASNITQCMCYVMFDRYQQASPPSMTAN